MNLFVIPSWYPNRQYPLAGSFVAEQVRCFAELNPDIQVAVSVAGAGEYHLPVRRIGETLKVLGRYAIAKESESQSLKNMLEFHTPVLHWTPKLGANLHAVVAAHEKHLLRFIERHGEVACIHAHVTYPAGWVAMVLSERYRIPYIVTEHTGPFPVEIRRFIRNGRLTKWLSLPLEKAAKVLAVSPALADRMASLGVKEPQVMPNFVDERNFPLQPMPEGEIFTFLTAAAMIESKGVGDLLHAIRLLSERGIECRHLIAGSGSGVTGFKQLATKLGIAERIKWLGYTERRNMASLYAACHAFVLPSWLETFGVVYAEAIASGRPVIATRCGGPEALVNETNGLLVDVRDVGALADAMQSMVEGVHAYVPEAIRSDFMSRFSRPVVVKRLRRLYDGLSGKD